MSSGRSIPTVDRISDLPESILSHILSFLPTKFAATTSVLSKRWKPVWLSLIVLNFDDKAFNDFETFRKYVYSILFSSRDKKTSIQSFTLKLGNSSRFKQREYNRIFKFVMLRGVKNLNFNMFLKSRCIKLPLGILNCKTLQVLRLENIKMWDFDRVDFPCLKTLHLDRVDFQSPKYFAKFLCGCPILEDLNARSDRLRKSLDPVENLNALPNLVEARICYDMYNMMTLVCKARILHLEQIRGMPWKTLPMFHNLTHMELTFFHSSHDEEGECRPLIEILSHFPNLQHLSAIFVCNKCLKVPPNPTIAPECLSSQLKTFRYDRYTGGECDFNFVKYIMQHSKVLETMTIRSFALEKNQMFMKLSSCTMSSATCLLLFD